MRIPVDSVNVFQLKKKVCYGKHLGQQQLSEVLFSQPKATIVYSYRIISWSAHVSAQSHL